MTYILYFFQLVLAGVLLVIIFEFLLEVYVSIWKKFIYKYFPLQKEKVPVEIHNFGIYNFDNKQEINFSVLFRDANLIFKPKLSKVIVSIITPGGQILIDFAEQISCYDFDNSIFIRKELTPAQMQRILEVYPMELNGVDTQNLFLQLHVFYKYYGKNVELVYHAPAEISLYTKPKEQND